MLAEFRRISEEPTGANRKAPHVPDRARGWNPVRRVAPRVARLGDRAGPIAGVAVARLTQRAAAQTPRRPGVHRPGAPVVHVQAGLEREADRAVHLVRGRRDLAARGSREAQLRLLEAAVVRRGRPREQRRARPSRAPHRRDATGRPVAPRAARRTARASARARRRARARGCARPARYASVAAFQARQQAVAATSSSRPDRARRSTRTVPAAVERDLRPAPRTTAGRGRARHRAPEPRATRAASAWRARPSDPERSPERRLVDETDRRRGAPELDPAGDDRAEQLVAGPELAPAGRGEPRGELVVAIVLPARRARARAAGSPVADRGSHRLGEERELVGDVEPHRELREDGLGVGAERGRRARRGVPARRHGRTARAGRSRPRPGWSTRPDEPLGDDLRVGVDALALLHAPARHAGRLEPLEPRRDRLLARTRRAIAAVSSRLPASTALVVGNEVRRVDRRVVEPEQRRGTLVAARG